MELDVAIPLAVAFLMLVFFIAQVSSGREERPSKDPRQWNHKELREQRHDERMRNWEDKHDNRGRPLP